MTAPPVLFDRALHRRRALPLSPASSRPTGFLDGNCPLFTCLAVGDHSRSLAGLESGVCPRYPLPKPSPQFQMRGIETEFREGDHFEI